MAFSSADWTIDYGAKTVTNNDSSTGNNLPATLGTTAKVGTVLAFFQWLATEFANSAQMDDDYAFLSDTPTVYRYVNGWAFGHADDTKYLEGGSIESSDGNDLWSNLYSIGSQTTGTQISLFQNDTEISPWWITGNVDILVKVKSGGTFIQSDNTIGVATDGGVWLYAREFGDLYDHGFADLSGGGRNPLGVNTAADGSNISGELYLTPAAVGAMAAGNFIVGGTSGAIGKIAKVVAGDVYLNSVRGGPFVISETLTEYSDRELQTATGESSTNDGTTAFTDTVAGYTDIDVAFVQRNMTGGTTATGPFVFGETITQSVSGATFTFVAEVSNILYLEDLAGTPDGTNLLTGGTSSATYTPTATAAATSVNQDLNNGAGAQPYNVFIGETTRSSTEIYEWTKYITRYGSIGAAYTLNNDDGQEYRSANEGTYAEVKSAPFGSLAGTTFYGATGVWMAEYTIADFVLIDANSVVQSPPNYQKVNANHTSLIGTQVFVAEQSAGNVIKNQYTILAVTTTTIQATASIDINKAPQTGVVRVGDTRYTYTGFSGDTFSGVSPNPTGETGDFYVPLLDVLADATSELSDNIIYNTDINVKTTVRKYGFKQYSVDTTFGSAGLTFSPVLTDDPQAV